MKRFSHQAYRLRLLVVFVLALSFLLLVSSFKLSVAQKVSQAGWRVEVEEGKSARSTLTINNRCSEPHLFRIKSSVKYLRFEQPTDSVLIAASSDKQLGVRFDATGLKSKVHRSKVVVDCLDCKKKGSRCTQDRDEVSVELTVVRSSIAKKQTSSSSSNTQAGEWGIHRTLYIMGGYIRCNPPARECFDDIVVKPKAFDTLLRFNEAVDSNTTATFFSGGEWKILFPDLERFPRQLNMLRGGLPLLRFESNADGVVRYLATRQSREQIINQTRGKSRTLISGVEFCLSVRKEQ